MIIRSFTNRSIFKDDVSFSEISEFFVGIGCATLVTNKKKENSDQEIKILVEKIKIIGGNNNSFIQLYDSNSILSEDHLFFSVFFSIKSHLQKTNISNNISIENLLYASQQRQIHLAIDSVGFKIQNEQDKQIYFYTITGKGKERITKSKDDLFELIGSTDCTDLPFSPNKEKILSIQEKFKISDFELLNSIRISGYFEELDINKIPIITLEPAILRCLVEKMSFLSLEK